VRVRAHRHPEGPRRPSHARRVALGKGMLDGIENLAHEPARVAVGLAHELVPRPEALDDPSALSAAVLAGEGVRELGELGREALEEGEEGVGGLRRVRLVREEERERGGERGGERRREGEEGGAEGGDRVDVEEVRRSRDERLRIDEQAEG